MVDSYDGRDFRRMDIDCEVEIHRIAADVIICGKATNLSATGLSFSCAELLQFDDELEIKINPGQEGLTPPLHAIAKVVRVDEIAENSYIVGCIISEMLG